MESDDSDTQATNKPGKPSKSKDTAAPSKTRSAALPNGLALILSIIALLGTAYTGYTYNIKRGLYRADIFSRLDKLEDESLQYKRTDLAHDERLAQIRETQDTMKSAMDKLSTDLGKGRGEWLLAETEQLLRTANHRLQLARDVNLALAALRAADRQLQELADPAYLPVRKLLAEEVNNLEAVERVDITGMSLRLGSIATRVDRLPLLPGTEVSATEPTDIAAAAPESTAREMWNDLVSLVRIRRSDEVRKPLLMPEQHYFLRENLRLMLYGAQIALLQGDSATFEQNVKTARQWIKDNFDNNASMVQDIQADLEEMIKARLSARLPDITRSLETLRRISAKKARP